MKRKHLRVIGVLLCVVLGSFSPRAAGQQPAQSEEKVDLRDLRDNVRANVQKIIETLKTEKVHGIDLCSFSKMMDLYSKDPNIERATKINKDYFVRSAKGLKVMSDYKTYLEVCEIHNKTADSRYAQAKKVYDPLPEKMIKFLDDPPRVN